MNAAATVRAPIKDFAITSLRNSLRVRGLTPKCSEQFPMMSRTIGTKWGQADRTDPIRNSCCYFFASGENSRR